MLETHSSTNQVCPESSVPTALELVREGVVDLDQKEAFAPIYFRKHRDAVASGAGGPDMQVE